MIEEIYKDIEGFEGLYQVSNYGRVKSLHYGKERILRQQVNFGYCCVYLRNQNKERKNCLVHRLVAQAFIDNPNNYEEVNHIDEDKMNNHVTNLEWCDRKYNANYGTAIQRCALKRINNPKLSKQVLCVETGVVYPSTIEVERQLGFSQGNISYACNGRYKQAYGYTWCYV